ncbi:MAG: Rne/Rng family ribonuclease [Proteobacteria bacterium]|nr:Rne/Rng family ribonuclease [Pseudomonadota bacterium]MBU1689042.1 Rne/Rng family ribonuclease [Pseudomonadota bacterium]
MTEERTTNPPKDNIEPKKNEPAGSVIARIGQWFSGGRKNSEDKPMTEPSAPEVREEKKAETAEGRSPEGGAPRRRRSRRPTRSKRPKEIKPDAEVVLDAPVEEKSIPAVKKEKSPAEESEGDDSAPAANVLRKLLINTDEPEECRIALLENGRIEAFFVETVLHTQTKGNIYKGKIVSVEPSLQAAFVDLGEGKNGFLPFNEIHPEYYHGEVDPQAHWKSLDMEKVLRKGSEVLVQVVKEATGNKGANMTTYLSLPGRYLVLMPGSDSAGISRKIESESQRTKLRSMVDSLTLPEGIGYIVRTASRDITKTAVSQDLKYLLNLWEEIKERGQKQPTPSIVYREQDIIARFLRDHYTQDIKEIMVDNEEAFLKVKKFLNLIPTGQKKTVARLHKGTQPIFNHYQVEAQIEQIFQPTVSLPSGGSIVINPTEALVAIDVNSGRTSKDKNFDESIFLANMEAAEELARQLRLRDLGGLIVVDFIDMRDSRHIREVEKKVKTSMKQDKARVDISRISRFGLMQISRQKLASPVQMGNYNVCEHCKGRGVVRSVETLALVYLRLLQTEVVRKNVKQVTCRLPIAVARYLLNKKRADLLEMENRYQVIIAIEPDPTMSPTDQKIETIRG